MIYAFLSDSAFANASIIDVVDYKTLAAKQYGMLDKYLLNYFTDHKIITDPLATTSVRPARLTVDQATGSTISPLGNLIFHFDGNKLSTADQTAIDAFTIKETDDSATKAEKLKKRGMLFNMMQYVYMSRYTSKLPYELADIEERFTSGEYANYYIAGSLKLSDSFVTTRYRYETVQSGSIIAKQSPEYFFRSYFIFTFKYGNATSNTIQIKVWLGSQSFKEYYPYSTITDVIYPCKPKWIMNPEQSGGEVAAVLKASDYKDQKLDEAITAQDHSGAHKYYSKYIHSTVAADTYMGFVVLYKGAAPTSSEMRDAIRNDIITQKDESGTLIGTITEWKQRLPDLFIDAEYFLYPLYYQRKNNIFSSVTIERSIAKYSTIKDKINIVSSDENAKALMEIMRAPAHDLFIATIPGGNNTQEHTGIRIQHPSYQAIDSVGSIYKFQLTTDTVYTAGVDYYYRVDSSAPLYEYTKIDTSGIIGQLIPAGKVYNRILIEHGHWDLMPSKTKEFAQYMAYAIAAAISPETTTSSYFTYETLTDASGTPRQHIAFVSNFIQYHMMTLLGAQGLFDQE